MRWAAGIGVVLPIILAAYLLSRTTGTDASPKSRSVPFEHLALGQMQARGGSVARAMQGIPAQRRVFTDPESWDAFWRRYGCEPLRVDFDRKWVAAVFAGARPNAGYGVEIQSVEQDMGTGKVIVNVIERKPSPLGMYPQVVVHPADVVAFDKQLEFRIAERAR